MAKQVKKEPAVKPAKEPAVKPSLTVSEAGQKGGKRTHALYGKEFYEGIGKKGGARVRELIARGKVGETKAAEPDVKPAKVSKKVSK